MNLLAITKLFKKALSFVTLLTMFSTSAHARLTDLRAYGPLSVRTQNPLYLQLLALPIESTQTLNKKQFETQLTTTFSNLYERQGFGATQLTFDMEIWRTALNVSYGITDNFDLKIEFPFITNAGGFLDSFIQAYHNAFGFPNGGRNLTANGQFQFTLAQNGITLFDYPQTGFGFSDVTIRGKYLALHHIAKFPIQLAIAPYLKLPTGEASRGLSNGHFDFGTQVLAETQIGKRFHLISQVGGVFLTGADNYGALLNTAFFQFGQSVEFQIRDGWSILAELTGNTSAFKNVSARELSDPVVDLNIGFAGEFPLRRSPLDEFFYQFSFGEDVMGTGPSVDFSVLFLAGVRY